MGTSFFLEIKFSFSINVARKIGFGEYDNKDRP